MKEETSSTMTRRRLLARLGLASGMAYVAPAMTHLGAAHASGASRGSRGSGISGRGYRYERRRGSGVSGRGSYGSGPSGRGRRDRVREDRVVDGILRTLDGLGVLR
ncbi:hypothetical protein [Roseovarius sp. D22-M7]|uniref:hypothetical protein n=1 Tax=Roseovarius sp. D22-M7 TaxID=3127116 RepID=UPI00300FEB06